jgi:hypothetical protein
VFGEDRRGIYHNETIEHMLNYFIIGDFLDIVNRLFIVPGSQWEKGKIERFFSSCRIMLLSEVEISEITTLAELNESFWA